MRIGGPEEDRLTTLMREYRVVPDNQGKKLEIEHEQNDGELPEGTPMSVRFRRYLDQRLLVQADTNRLLKDIRFALWTIGFVMVIGLNLVIPSCLNGL